jgi:hypothetical protein
LKLRYSLRFLLIIATTAVALAAFWAVRSRPSRFAAQLQEAIRSGNQDAAALLRDVNIPEALGIKPFESWEIESIEFRQQSFTQWLSGECLGKLVVSSRGTSDDGDVTWFASQEFECDVAVSSAGLQIRSVVKGEPALAGAPKPPYEK